jgi:predicted alpha/beta superfamily hydrolase
LTQGQRSQEDDSTRTGPGSPGGNAGFEKDFLKDVKPYVEKHYRVRTDQPSRAIAGLSMGGDQTFNILGSRPKDFAYVGVFGSGVMFRNVAD